MLLSMKRCDSFYHSVIIVLFSSSTVLNLVCDRLVDEGTANSIIHWIKIRAVWGLLSGLKCYIFENVALIFCISVVFC